jgi:plasmid maintenance system killer protein
VHIRFKSTRLEKELSEDRRVVTTHGPRRAKLIKQRLAEIEAAASLAVLRLVPGPRCHELHGDRKGQISVDLDHPYRLLFVPDHDPAPVNEAAGGGLDWSRVTAVMVVEVADTHE